MGHALPVVQLEQHLRVHRHPPQRRREHPLLHLRVDALARRRRQVLERGRQRIEALPRAPPVMGVEQVPGDAEEIAAKAGHPLSTKAVTPLHTRQQCPLNQVINVACNLAGKEPVEPGKVAREQQVSRRVVPFAPALQQGPVVVVHAEHRRSHMSRAGRRDGWTPWWASPSRSDRDRTSSGPPDHKDRRGITPSAPAQAFKSPVRVRKTLHSWIHRPHTRRSKKSANFRDPLPDSRHYPQQPEASPHLKGLP